jgi:hypothetical protein
MMTTLLEPHRQKLLACGLTPETWSRARLHSGSPEEVRDTLGYGVQGGGLIIPYDETCGFRSNVNARIGRA